VADPVIEADSGDGKATRRQRLTVLIDGEVEKPLTLSMQDLNTQFSKMTN